MSRFTDWKNEADIPEFINGRWVDLETGIPFEDAPEKLKNTYQDKYAEQIDAAKKASKSLKLKSLTGTASQKKWAVQIRLERFTSFKNDSAKEYINYTKFLSSKFWIETRSMKAAEIESFIIEIANLVIQVNLVNEEYSKITPQQGRIVTNREELIIVDKYWKIINNIDSKFSTFLK